MNLRPDGGVSVVIPAKDAGPYLGDCLRSVLGQTLRPSEVIVVDDHSGDETAAVARSFGASVRVLTNPGRGVASALNHGIAAARSGLIAHFDADDLMRPQKLARQVALYASPRAEGLGFVGSDLRMFDEQGPDPETFFDRRPLFRRRFPDVAADGVIWLGPEEARRALCHEYCVDIKGVYLKKAWEEVGGFDTSMRCVNDMDFVWRLAGRYQVALVDEVLVDGRRHATNMSRDGRLVAEECIVLFRRMLASGLPADDRGAVRRRINREHHDLAHLYRKASEYRRSALSYLRYALNVA
jgi:glycosyltransferase involved in cell wall biosynthesis